MAARSLGGVRHGYSVRNGVGFGGGADGLQHDGPIGVYYTFANADIELHAAAVRLVAPAVVSKKHANPWVVAGLVVGLLSPVGVGVGWLISVSSRVSVLESSDAAMRVKVEQLGDLSTQLAAVKQELSDFRSEFRDWKRENGFGTPLRTRDDVRTPSR